MTIVLHVLLLKEPAPTSSSQPSTWQSPPPQRSTQQIGPVTNGELHPSNEALGSPYRPGDPQHDQDRYNPGYRPNEPQQRQPLSPQESRRPEFRPAPEGYSSGLPRSVSPTVTLLQYQRGRNKIALVYLRKKNCFLHVWFSCVQHCHGRKNFYLSSCFIKPGSYFL